MHFQKTVFENEKMYELVTRSLLFGYGKNSTNLYHDCKADTNAIVYGITEATARLRVSDTFKGQSYENIYCFGPDSKLSNLSLHLDKARFNGHVIVCPEVGSARDHAFAHLAETLYRVSCDAEHGGGRWGREFQVLIPNESTDRVLMGALFEHWKNSFVHGRQIYVDHEKSRFRQFDYQKHFTGGRYGEMYENHQKELFTQVPSPREASDVVNDTGLLAGLRMAPPHDLDPDLTYAVFRDHNKRFDTSQQHPVRMGRDFDHLSGSEIKAIISELTPHSCGDDRKYRIVCVDDSLLWKIFLSSNRFGARIVSPDGESDSCGGQSRPDGDDPETVQMDEISKK